MELKHFVEVGNGFYNLKTPFVMYGVIDIGTQMSLLRLQSTDRFLVIDTCAMSSGAKEEFDRLTSNGTLIDAVIATHPFHTIYFEAFHAMYPTLKYYGTPRHIKTIPSITWTGDVSTEAVRSLWASEVIFSYRNATAQQLEFVLLLNQPILSVKHSPGFNSAVEFILLLTRLT
jgi:hypothetical protein